MGSVQPEGYLLKEQPLHELTLKQVVRALEVQRFALSHHHTQRRCLPTGVHVGVLHKCPHLV